VEAAGFDVLVEDVAEDGLPPVADADAAPVEDPAEADADPADGVEAEDVPGFEEVDEEAVLLSAVLPSLGEVFEAGEEEAPEAAPEVEEEDAGFAVPALAEEEDDEEAPLAGLSEGADDAPVVPGFEPLAADVGAVEVLLSSELSGFVPTFSAFRSMVTGRLEDPPEEDVLSLSGFSEDPEPFPPDEEDAPPEDFLSVAICSPPDPQGLKTFTIHTSLRSGTARPRLFRAAKHGLSRIRLTLR